MLEPIYRYTIFNNSGAAITGATIREDAWKYNSDASVSFNGWTNRLSSTSSTANGSMLNGGTVSNTFKGTNANVLVTVSGSGTSSCTIFLEFSFDSGTTWPDAQKGIPIGSIVPGSKNKMMTV